MTDHAPNRTAHSLLLGAAALCAPALAAAQTVPAPSQFETTTAPPTPHPETSPGTSPGMSPAASADEAAAPLAGWHNDVFYLTDPGHNAFLIPSGRLQLDGVYYLGDGVTDDYTTGAMATYHRGDVKDGFQLRRARIELLGGFLDRYTFQLGSEFTTTSAPVATDLVFDARAFPMLHFQLGQFDAPFTMENRTSDKYLEFQERSLAVRGLGIPTNKEIGLMVWGETTDRLFYYSLGVFNGDGQNNRATPLVPRDNDLDVMGRVFAHPLINTGGLLANLQLGGSFRYGRRGASVDYAYNNIATQSGFTVFNSTLSSGATGVTVVPDGDQLGVAGELVLPIDRVDLRGEFVYVNNNTREMVGASLAGSPVRSGSLSGYGYYAQLGYWVWGTPGVNGRPGYENPASLRLGHADPPTLPQGLELLLRFEQLRFTYDGGARATGGLAARASDGLYQAMALDLGVNYWATKHVRFTLNYMEYLFGNQPADPAHPGADENHMHGPHNNNAGFGELMFRVGLAI